MGSAEFQDRILVNVASLRQVTTCSWPDPSPRSALHQIMRGNWSDGRLKDRCAAEQIVKILPKPQNEEAGKEMHRLISLSAQKD